MPWSPQAGGSGAHRVARQRGLRRLRRAGRSVRSTLAAGDDRLAAARLRARRRGSRRRPHRTGRDDPRVGEPTPTSSPGTGWPSSPPTAASATGRPGRWACRRRARSRAKFVEVRVDADLGLIRVARVVSAIDGGRILNEKTARSQIIGGTVGGIGMALLEETVTDAGTGRIANATLRRLSHPGQRRRPGHRRGLRRRARPLQRRSASRASARSALVGIAAAIANAVYHATGGASARLPITLDRLL